VFGHEFDAKDGGGIHDGHEAEDGISGVHKVICVNGYIRAYMRLRASYAANAESKECAANGRSDMTILIEHGTKIIKVKQTCAESGIP